MKAKTQRRRSARGQPTKARPNAPREQAAGGRSSRPERRPPRAGRPAWSGAGSRVALLALVTLAGLLAWWAIASHPGSDEIANDAPRPIARLDAPDVHSLLVDPANPDHLLFGSHAGIQESRDGGFTWEAGELRNVDAMSLAASPKEATTVYAAGHDVLQVSRDGGQTWQPLDHDLPGTDVHAFAQDPNDPRRLYAYVVGSGVFTSGDGGTTWTPTPAQPPGGPPLALAMNGSALFAATQPGIAVSRDQGASWTVLPSQPTGGAISLAVSATDPNTLYAGTPEGLARSADGGQSWTLLGRADVPVLALAAAPSDPARVLFVSEEGAVYRSDDGGATWREPR